MEYELLRSQIEGSFGDQNDQDGLADFLEQLQLSPELAPEIVGGLNRLAESGDPKLCQELVADYAHRAVDAGQAVAWVRDLQAKVAAQVAC